MLDVLAIVISTIASKSLFVLPVLMNLNDGPLKEIQES
jgi:hypothetical protein